MTVNDPKLMARVLPSLRKAATTNEVPLVTAAEDFSYFANQLPGVFFFLGGMPKGQDPATAPANHSDHFFVDEGALPIGLRAMTQVAWDYLNAPR